MTSPDGWYKLPTAGHPIILARFIARPNRFLVLCEGEAGTTIRAFLPNPGRLSELFLPDSVLFLLHQPDAKKTRATQYTVLAVKRNGYPVMLHTHWCNHMARTLLEEGAVPGLEKAHILRSEVPVGRSRFDFLMRDSEGEIYVEVKSCTLFGNGVAMFPDAITARGRRHLLELAAIANSGAARSAVLFIVQTPEVSCFTPDYHTDPAFAQAMLDVHDHVMVLPVPIRWDNALRFQPAGHLLPIPWNTVEQESGDRGAYLVILKLARAQSLAIGGLGICAFRPGYYLYTGSAMQGLTARMARHHRKRKRMHWHIDYLRDAAEIVELLPIRSAARLECDIARTLEARQLQHIPGFGCSDCACPSHLFYLSESPLDQPWFHKHLQQWRTNWQHPKMLPV